MLALAMLPSLPLILNSLFFVLLGNFMKKVMPLASDYLNHLNGKENLFTIFVCYSCISHVCPTYLINLWRVHPYILKIKFQNMLNNLIRVCSQYYVVLELLLRYLFDGCCLRNVRFMIVKLLSIFFFLLSVHVTFLVPGNSCDFLLLLSFLFPCSKPNCRLLVTHDDYSMMSKLPKEKTSVVTILRNPIDRVFSTYEFSVEVAARFLVHPNLTSATHMAGRLRSKTNGVSTLDIWPWKYLVPWMREDLFARVPFILLFSPQSSWFFLGVWQILRFVIYIFSSFLINKILTLRNNFP